MANPKVDQKTFKRVAREGKRMVKRILPELIASAQIAPGMYLVVNATKNRYVISKDALDASFEIEKVSSEDDSCWLYEVTENDVPNLRMG